MYRYMKPQVFATIVVVLSTSQAAWGQVPTGAQLFERHCVACHSGAADSRAPSLATLRLSAPEAILRALTTGIMQPQGAKLAVEERRGVAEFLAGRPLREELSVGTVGRCATSSPFSGPRDAPRWNGWGVGPTNTRFQPADQARLAAADVPKLKLKWAFGFPEATAAWSQPVVVG